MRAQWKIFAFRLNNGFRLRRRQRLSVAFASNADGPAGRELKQEKSDAQGPPFLTILAGLLVFALVFWLLGSILTWLFGLIVKSPPSKWWLFSSLSSMSKFTGFRHYCLCLFDHQMEANLIWSETATCIHHDFIYVLFLLDPCSYQNPPILGVPKSTLNSQLPLKCSTNQCFIGHDKLALSPPIVQKIHHSF